MPLADKEIQESLERARAKSGKTLAQAINFIGERAFEKWLDSESLERDVDFNVIVKRRGEVRQYYIIWGIEVGVTSTKHSSLDEALSSGAFLYPAKEHQDESKRLLAYSQYLVQTVVSTDAKQCWLYGYVDRKTIMASPIQWIFGKAIHLIPVGKYKPLKELLKRLRTESYRGEGGADFATLQRVRRLAEARRLEHIGRYYEWREEWRRIMGHWSGW
jgi:hypothetical protein